jgi:D-alanine-D-alanine ligase
MREPRVVLVLFGGRSAEHEISLLSARFVIDSLDRARFRPLLCGIDKQGVWRWLREESLTNSNDPRQVSVDVRAPRASIWPMPTLRPLLHIEGEEPVPFDVVFPVLHGPFGEDGCLQGLLELAGVPYVGSGVAASAVGMDKLLQKRIFEQAELPVVRYLAFDSVEFGRERASLLERCGALGFPLFVKPVNMGSSLGVSKVEQASALRPAIEHALEFDTMVIVERGLHEPREIEFAVLGNEDARVSEAGEIVVEHRDGFYSYDAKYLDPDGARLCVPADLGAAEKSALELLALRGYRVLGCSGLARVDMFVAGGEAYLNEVNTMPGFTANSMYPRLWQASGVGRRELVLRLIELGCERHAVRSRLRTSR